MTAPQFAAWLALNAVPFSVFGILLVIAGLYFDRVSTPASRRIFCALVVAITLGAVLSAATVVNDQCTDPNYINTWWWYLWGCYLR